MNAEELNRKAIKASKIFLERKGYEVLETSWECPAGSIDIIARDDSGIVFIEVNATSMNHGSFPDEADTAAKRTRFERIALAYMAGRDETNMSIRFDIVSMVVMNESRAMLRHHINALSADPV